MDRQSLASSEALRGKAEIQRQLWSSEGGAGRGRLLWDGFVADGGGV